jgi:hypothetical protein
VGEGARENGESGVRLLLLAFFFFALSLGGEFIGGLLTLTVGRCRQAVQISVCTVWSVWSCLVCTVKIEYLFQSGVLPSSVYVRVPSGEFVSTTRRTVRVFFLSVECMVLWLCGFEKW